MMGPATSLLLAALLPACTPAPEDSADPPGPVPSSPATDSEPPPEDPADPDTDAKDTAQPVDVDAPGEPPAGDTAVESVGAPEEDLAGWLYTSDRVIEIAIEMPQESVDALWADPYSYVPASVDVDGHLLPNVGIRLKGKIGSYQDLDHKSGFKVKVDKYVDGAEFYGIEKLTLNNAIVDYSYVKEHIGYMAYRAMGVPASRTGYAWVTLNGEPYGLYVQVETIDNTFLDRNYEDPSGNLYDGKYVYYGGWSYTLLDLTRDVYELYQLEEGVDVGHADLLAIVETIEDHGGQPTWMPHTSSLVDWEQLVREFAVEQWIGQLDGYALNTNNYRLYLDPARGDRASIIPWDLDYAFGYDWTWGMSWTSPRGVLAAWCMADAACYELWRAAVAETCDTMDALALEHEIDRRAALIEPYVAMDSRDWSDPSTTAYYQDEMRAWVNRRSDELRDFWGL